MDAEHVFQHIGRILFFLFDGILRLVATAE